MPAPVAHVDGNLRTLADIRFGSVFAMLPSVLMFC
jgi:hypothetical protein